jgi:glyoxylase-like metal-dependent hydrolase (beta-lactamase superfamily II)
MGLRVHHLSCATLCPPSPFLLQGRGSLLGRGRLVCHCLLVETEGGLLLVDTGLGLADIAEPNRRLGMGFGLLLKPSLRSEESALRQVESRGFRAGDVRHILLTHLDPDHAGGLADFPLADVHVLGRELDAALSPRTLGERGRYRAPQWEHGPRWVRYGDGGDTWFGLEAVRDLPGLPPEVLLIPLFGHTRGHSGVAVQGEEGWWLHAGDAYFSRQEVDPSRSYSPLGLALFSELDAVDGAARRRNVARLRRLLRERSTEVRVFCAHDPEELASAQAVA